MRGAFRRLILPLLLCAALLTGCAPGEPQKYTVAFYDAFDTVTTFTAWAESQAEFDRWASQVHDELLIETRKEELTQVARILEEEMKGAASLQVELEVDMHEGSSWYEAK